MCWVLKWRLLKFRLFSLKSVNDWPPGFPLCAAVTNKEEFTAIYLNDFLIRAASIPASQSLTGRSLYFFPGNAELSICMWSLEVFRGVLEWPLEGDFRFWIDLNSRLCQKGIAGLFENILKTYVSVKQVCFFTCAGAIFGPLAALIFFVGIMAVVIGLWPVHVVVIYRTLIM